MKAYKPLYIVIFIITFPIFLFGQSKNFVRMSHIQEDWEGRGACDTLYYRDAVEPFVIDQAIKFIRSKNKFPLSNLYAGKQTQPLSLSKSEKQYLIIQLLKLKAHKWPASMFPYSKLIISKVQANSVLRRTSQLPGKKANNCSIIYTFSRPVYLKNKTLAFYLEQEQYSPTMEELSFDFYKKEHEEWEIYADGYVNMGKEEKDPSASEKEQNEEQVPTKISLTGDENAGPESLVLFGKDVAAAFRATNNTSFEALFPTAEQQMAITAKMGITVRKISAEKMKAKQDLMHMLRLNNVREVLDSARALRVNWSDVKYVAIKRDIHSVANTNKGDPLAYTGATITCTDGKQTFNLIIEAIYYIDNEWKILNNITISGI